MSQAQLKDEALPTITVSRVPTLDGEGVLVAREPLVFYPVMLPGGEHFKAEYQPIDISAIEENFDQLEPAILDQIAYMWYSYTSTPEKELAPDAIEAKKTILKHFELQK